MANSVHALSFIDGRLLLTYYVTEVCRILADFILLFKSTKLILKYQQVIMCLSLCFLFVFFVCLFCLF